MNVTLKLRYSPQSDRPAAAWWLPGASPSAWLAELTSWRVPLDEARLMLFADETPGAIVLLGGEQRPSANTIAIPYALVAGRLLVPVECAFDPPLTDAELPALLPSEAAYYVWHPTLGIQEFAEHDVRCVADLVAAGPVAERRWNSAQPGTAVNSRLLSVEALEELTLQDIVDAGRDDIGSQSIAGSQLPPAPGEPPGGAIGRAIAAAGLHAAAGVARAVAAAAGAVSGALASLGVNPTGASGAGRNSRSTAAGRGPQGTNWLQRLKTWAVRQQQALSKNLDQLRNRQLERLLNALTNSPDEGLKFALPLTGGAGGRAARGLAPPGSSLIEHNVDFNLNRLGGGGPVDLWNMPPEYSQRLARLYRELANREISLGRHRRAAYILAELLGDLSAAAATLADGGHFREAAVLYEERLGQPLSAAKCLQRGGLFTAAIALFQKLHEWETVGDLYQRLDQPEAAQAAWRQAVERQLSGGDRLAAARLLEEKLAARDEAHGVLISGWPSSTQARQCLDESFELLRRHQLHQRANQSIARVHQATMEPEMHAVLASALARLATAYPDEDVRQSAGETTRQLVGGRLSEASPTEVQSLLGALASLVPGDRLLEGDCRRYQHWQAERRRQKPLPVPTGRRRKAVCASRSFRLPWGDWRSVAVCGDEFYAAGLFRNWLRVVRGRWDGEVQIAVGQPWTASHELRGRPILLAADPRGLGKLYVHLAEGCPQHAQTFSATDKFRSGLVAGPHPGSTAATEAMCYGADSSVYLFQAAEEWTVEVKGFVSTERLEYIRTFALSPQMLEDSEVVRPLPFHVRGNSFYLGLGATLLSLREGQQSTTLHSTIRSIVGSPWLSRARIVVGCAQGGVVVWGVTADSPHSTFAMDLAEPVVGLARGGSLAAATADVIEVSGTQGGRLSWVGTTDGPKQPPIAVTPTSAADQFAVFTQDGLVTIYDVPAP